MGVYIHKGDISSWALDDFQHNGYPDIAVDIETNWVLDFRQSEIGCITIGMPARSSVHIVQLVEDVLPFRVFNLLEDNARPKLWHNGIFDIRTLLWHFPGLQIAGTQGDTKLLAKLAGEERTGLKALLEKYRLVEPSSSEAHSDWFAHTYTSQQAEYCRRDVAFLQPLSEILFQKLDGATRIRYALYCDALVARATCEVFDHSPDIWGQR